MRPGKARQQVRSVFQTCSTLSQSEVLAFATHSMHTWHRLMTYEQTEPVFMCATTADAAFNPGNSLGGPRWYTCANDKANTEENLCTNAWQLPCWKVCPRPCTPLRLHAVDIPCLRHPGLLTGMTTTRIVRAGLHGLSKHLI